MTNRLLVLLSVLVLGACVSSEEGAGAPSGGSLQQVPRNRTFISDCLHDVCAGQFGDFDSLHPYLPGATSTTGFN